MIQRKYRNLEERNLIKTETMDKLTDIGLTIHVIPYLVDFIKILDEFVENKDNGKYFVGVFKIPDLGLEIEYNLQGRRVLPHYAKVRQSAK